VDKIGDGYARDLEITLNRFSRDIKGQVSEVTESIFKDWLQKGKFGISARNAYIRDLKQFFAWCAHRDRRWSTINPCEHLERSQIRRETPVVYTPEEAQKLMVAAWENRELEMLAWYAIGLCSGVRVEELGRVRWKWVDLQEKLIPLSGWFEGKRITKNGRPRPVKMTDELVAWLRPVAKEEGLIQPTYDVRARRAKLHELAGVPQKHNALRHSFASYHASWHKNATDLQTQMGQKTATVLWEHYIQAASERVAEEYFAIRPPKKKKKKLAEPEPENGSQT